MGVGGGDGSGGGGGVDGGGGVGYRHSNLHQSLTLIRDLSPIHTLCDIFTVLSSCDEMQSQGNICIQGIERHPRGHVPPGVGRGSHAAAAAALCHHYSTPGLQQIKPLSYTLSPSDVYCR